MRRVVEDIWANAFVILMSPNKKQGYLHIEKYYIYIKMVQQTTIQEIQIWKDNIFG